MPIYEYQCSKCGHLEIFQRITEKPLERCPTCQRKVTKLISQSSFHLKGSGWYITDYARKGAGDTGSASDKTSSAPADKKSGSDTSKAKESSKATGTTASGDKSSSPTKDSGGSATKESGSSSPASGKMSGAGSAAV